MRMRQKRGLLTQRKKPMKTMKMIMWMTYQRNKLKRLTQEALVVQFPPKLLDLGIKGQHSSPK
jgi:hypothetical protein